MLFQSTSPTRGDDFDMRDDSAAQWISIHVPYERGRPAANGYTYDGIIFQSTSPTRGDDLQIRCVALELYIFQSTSPTRGDDLALMSISRSVPFQSTSPTRGDDGFHRRPRRRGPNFNPRPLREGTTARRASSTCLLSDFNPRPLREGTTARYCMQNSVSHNICKYCISCAPNFVLTCGQCNAESTFQGANLMCKSVIAICSHTQY